MKEQYDVIIIGAGIGGLTCGAILAKEGMKVLVIEQASKPGGYATSYRKDGFTFDSCVHFLGGCGEGGIISQIFRYLEIDREMEFIEIRSPLEVILGDEKILLPVSNSLALEEKLQALFPEEAQRIPEYHRILKKINQEILNIGSPSFLNLLSFPFRYPHLVRYHRSTLKDLLDRYFTDPRLRTILSLAPATLPASRISLFFMAIVAIQGQEGFYYPKGGIQSFSNLFVEGLRKRNGELLLNRSVEKILIERKRVVGVRLADGKRIESRCVVSNASLEETFFRLIGREHLPIRYIKRIESQKVSHSGFCLHLATDLDLKSLGVSSNISIPSLDSEKEYGALNNNQLPVESSIMISIPSLVDDSLAPEGRHVLHLLIPAPYEYNWEEERERIASKIIREAERAIPDLSSHILYQDVSTPLTLERYTRNTKGAMYGLQATPEQFGKDRIGQRTPIKNLYLVGHYTRPAHGVAGVAMSGQFAAQAILRRRLTQI